MKEMLFRKFRPTQDGDMYEQWATVEQTRTVAEYVRWVIELAAPWKTYLIELRLVPFLVG